MRGLHFPAPETQILLDARFRGHDDKESTGSFCELLRPDTSEPLNLKALLQS